MKESFYYIIAKNDSSEHKWLPLWVHCLDTYNVMNYLISHWLSESSFPAVTNNSHLSQIKKTALFLSVFHDYGKSSLAFQAKITDGVEDLHKLHNNVGLLTPCISDPELRNSKEMPHGIAGEIMLLIKGCPASLAAVIGAHHGKPWENGPEVEDEIQDILEIDEEEIYKNFEYSLRLWGGKARRKEWIKAQDYFYNWALKVTRINEIQELPPIDDKEAVVLSGLVIMADWLASNEVYFPLISYEQEIPDDMEERACLAEKKISLPPTWRPLFNEDFRGLSRKRFGFEPNEIQKEMAEAVINSVDPGLFILEAPMGVGKTEAALLAAEEFSDERVSGMLFALPTQATANGIFSRIIEWGEKQSNQNALSIRLAHGRAAMNEEYIALFDSGKHTVCDADDYENSRLIVHDFFQGHKQALLADFVVGTIDQVLLASLKQKHFMLRHLGLCGKVVIIDECHAYDAYMNEYLERTLQWLGAYRTPVIMLSATLSYERRAAFVDAYLGVSTGEKEEDWRKTTGYPILTWTDGNRVCQKKIEYSGIKREVEIEKIACGDTMSEQLPIINKILEEKLENGGCAAVILNTVKRAQMVYCIVKKKFPKKHVLLLHSRFIPEDRLEYERELLIYAGKKSTKVKRDGFIVIGTQVIEQSLDFDVDFMITDLCPMDLLLQRIGRLHRHTVHDELRPILLKKAKCCVLGTGDNPEKGSAAIYGEYLLMKTRYFLPSKMELPADIAGLVQKVYDDDCRMGEKPEGYESARSEHLEKRMKMKRDADAFRLLPPGKEKTINRFLEASVLPDEEQAKAQVRNGDETVEVIILFSGKEGLTRAPWRYKERLDVTVCPPMSICRSIANQRINFPMWVKGVIPEEKLKMPAAWEKSIWLNGQHLLVLSEKGKVEFDDLIIKYSYGSGLQVERKN